MKQLDSFSYQCGVMDAFQEVVSAGIKRLALSHPCTSQEEWPHLLEYGETLCRKYGTRMYEETSLLVSDLFPASQCKHQKVMIFYLDPQDLQQYLNLKQQKETLLTNNQYCGQARRKIAEEFGALLSYSDEAIATRIDLNPELESI